MLEQSCYSDLLAAPDDPNIATDTICRSTSLSSTGRASMLGVGNAVMGERDENPWDLRGRVLNAWRPIGVAIELEQPGKIARSL